MRLVGYTLIITIVNHYLIIRRPPIYKLFPYTTLFRSPRLLVSRLAGVPALPFAPKASPLQSAPALLALALQAWPPLARPAWPEFARPAWPEFVSRALQEPAAQVLPVASKLAAPLVPLARPRSLR